MQINTEYEFGDKVYLETDEDQLPRRITELQVMPGPLIKYCLTCGAEESWHYDFEFTKHRLL